LKEKKASARGRRPASKLNNIKNGEFTKFIMGAKKRGQVRKRISVVNTRALVESLGGNENKCDERKRELQRETKAWKFGGRLSRPKRGYAKRGGRRGLLRRQAKA